MRALSVRQPWAELILRGRKIIECRSRPTRVQERVWIYAARGVVHLTPIYPRTDPRIDAAGLPRGVLVGSVEIVNSRPLRRSDRKAACLEVDFDGYAWILAHPKRLAVPMKPVRHPQPTFFYPFDLATR
ncbi:MAG TPA: ASCH domain-containing protein [Kofleriaceae bacterium]